MDAQETSSSETQGARGAPNGRRGRPGVAALVVVGVVLAILGVFALIQATARQPLCACVGTGILPASTQPTEDWQVYHDPLGLFVMRLPPGWKASVSLGSFNESGPNGSDSGQTEDISFSNPALGVASPSLSVYAQQSHNTSLNCGARSHEASNFNGYPADSSMQAVWLFESENAHFQVDETIPGVLGPINPGGPMNPPTPLPAPPAPTVTAERTLVASALATFLPTARPLACG